jgi:hypothetical protein
MTVAATRGRLLHALPVALAAGLLVSYLVLWIHITPLDTGRSDFTNTYVGALLLRRGLGSSMYLPSLQTPLYLQLVAPLRAGTLPFLDSPTAAAVALPFTLLPLHTAYRLWSAMQLGLIAVAVLLAVRSAPGPRAGRRPGAADALIALSGAGSAVTLILGQWDGVWALGVALLYGLLRQRRMAAAGAVLAVTTLIAKPQLGLGLAAFVLGWHDRRLLLGAAAGGVATVGAWLVLAGTGGIAGFVAAAVHSIGVWQPSIMVSFLGITGNVVGDTPAAHIAGAVGSVVFMAVGGVLGASVRQRPYRLEAGLGAATVLSLLAAPHAFPQDLALLTPAVAWSLRTLRAEQRFAGWWLVTATWGATSLTVYLDIATKAARPLGVLTPWMLLGAAVCASLVCQFQGPPVSVGSALTSRGSTASPDPAAAHA